VNVFHVAIPLAKPGECFATIIADEGQRLEFDIHLLSRLQAIDFGGESLPELW
jgi:hypothetical protein